MNSPSPHNSHLSVSSPLLAVPRLVFPSAAVESILCDSTHLSSLSLPLLLLHFLNKRCLFCFLFIQRGVHNPHQNRNKSDWIKHEPGQADRSVLTVAVFFFLLLGSVGVNGINLRRVKQTESNNRRATSCRSQRNTHPQSGTVLLFRQPTDDQSDSSTGVGQTHLCSRKN